MQYPPASIAHPLNSVKIMQGATSMNYSDRLATFKGYWDDYEPTARQLAAIGHVYDRPPLETLEDGTRCISCSLFVPRDTSVRVLQGPLSGLSVGMDRNSDLSLVFHHPICMRLQSRVPLDSQVEYSGVYRIGSIRELFERRSKGITDLGQPGIRREQTSSLFSLPTEIRLQIYSMVLPNMDRITSILPLNRESGRLITEMAAQKIGPRDMTKINLLCTCKTVYEEALDNLFSNITYKFGSSKVLYLFLRHIGHHGRQLLTSIDIKCMSREDAITFALLASCTKLRNITIRLPRPRLLFPRAPLWTVDGMACLLQLSGMEQVHFGPCETPHYFDDNSPGAAWVRHELTRPRNDPGSIQWIDGYPEFESDPNRSEETVQS